MVLLQALELKAVFDKLQAAEQSGLSPENIRKLEEQAAEQVSINRIREIVSSLTLRDRA